MLLNIFLISFSPCQLLIYFFVSMDIPILEISYKQCHMIDGFVASIIPRFNYIVANVNILIFLEKLYYHYIDRPHSVFLFISDENRIVNTF